MLDDIAAEFPIEFFKELNGGIILLPETKRHKKSIGNDLFILGNYNRGGSMGRYITIFFGSLMRVYGHLSSEKIKEKLRNTVRHEFRHHIESLAGNDDLERIDRQYIADYQSGRAYDADDDEYEDDDVSEEYGDADDAFDGENNDD